MNTIPQYPNTSKTVAPHLMPYSLTHTYQSIVAKIQSNPERGECKKTTGIWDEFNRCYD